MSKITNKEKQKQRAIQGAERIIAEAKQTGLEGGAFIVLRTVHEDGNIDLDTIVLGDTAPVLAALETMLVEVCNTSGVPLTHVVSSLLKDC